MFGDITCKTIEKSKRMIRIKFRMVVSSEEERNKTELVEVLKLDVRYTGVLCIFILYTLYIFSEILFCKQYFKKLKLNLLK